MDGRRRSGLSAALDLAEANTFLRDGGYGLRVERTRASGSTVVGSGVGDGLWLGDRPTWADLYRVLVRLRRTRRHRDRGWLAGVLTRDERPPTQWRRVASHLVQRLTVTDSTPQNMCALTDEDGSVLFPDELLRAARRTGEPEETLLLQTEADGAELNRERALGQLRLRSRLASAVANDPVLRMHCATEPVPIALVDTSHDTAFLVRSDEQAPVHPRYPGGTVAASLDALLRCDDDTVPILLRHVIDSRFERHTDELGYFLEHFVRPLLRTFRLLLDNHRIGLYGLDSTGVGFELSPELEATGRVVIRDAGVHEPDAASAQSLAGVQRLMGTVDALVAGFGRVENFYRKDDIRAAVESVIAEEFQYLCKHTAQALSGEHPLRRFVHTIAPEQDTILKEVVRMVQERTRLRRRNPGLPRPTVVIDLDLCGIVPLRRLMHAVQTVSGPRPGAPEGIPELREPHRLSVLPAHDQSMWRIFVDRNGLGVRYPLVDWEQVHADFVRAYRGPWEKLRTDTLSPGLGRFVWDVQDAGGQTVFSTGRRERNREYSEHVLAQEGLAHCPLLCLPDDDTGSVSELKVAELRALGELDLVAVFADAFEDRIAITKEYPGARAVAVEVPGIVTERAPGQPVPDGVPVISTFETSPEPVRARRTPAGPSLSHTHSLEELQIGALRSNRPAFRWAAYLSEAESIAVTATIVSDVDAAAERTGRAARAKFGLDDTPATDEGYDRTLRALRHVFTRKQFMKGSRSHYQYDDMRRDAMPFVRRQRAIDVILLGFPVKQCLNRLKACGPLPDLAEFGGLARLRELQRAVRMVYPPGLHFRILTDGRHFRPRPAALTGAYGRKLRKYADLVGIGGYTTIEDIDEVALRLIGPQLPAERAIRVARHRSMLREVLRRFDIADNPLRSLERLETFASEVDGPESVVRSLGQFRELLMSVGYSVPVALPQGTDRLSWSKRVYADLYHLTDKTVSPAVRQARTAILRRAWHVAIRYLAVLRADEELGYDELFPDRVRLSVSAAQPGRCGFTYLGGAGLLPWQGTGVLDGRGHVATDFLISLLDQGFLPVYSALLGPRQPWFMVPAQHVRPDRRGSKHGIRLDEDFLGTARLRRK